MQNYKGPESRLATFLQELVYDLIAMTCALNAHREGRMSHEDLDKFIEFSFTKNDNIRKILGGSFSMSQNDITEVTNRQGVPENSPLKDSGNRTQFEGGAMRDMGIPEESKGRFDLVPLGVISKLYNYEQQYPGLPKPDPHTVEAFDYIEKYRTTGDKKYLYACLVCFINCEVIDVTRRDGYTNRWQLLLDLAKHYENGAKKYAERNWELGMPYSVCIDSALRHYTKFRAGMKDEPHEIAFVWNIITVLFYIENGMTKFDNYTQNIGTTEK